MLGRPEEPGSPGRAPPGCPGSGRGGPAPGAPPLPLPGFILSPAPARTQARPSSSEHPLQPWELLSKVRGAPSFG